MAKKKRHYSARLGRQFQDGDELTRDEAAQVLSENAGREIDPKTLFDLVRAGVAHPRILSPRKLLYPYEEIKSYVVSARSGPHLQEHPASSSALRVRRFRDRRRADDAQKKMETSVVC